MMSNMKWQRRRFGRMPTGQHTVHHAAALLPCDSLGLRLSKGGLLTLLLVKKLVKDKCNVRSSCQSLLMIRQEGPLPPSSARLSSMSNIRPDGYRVLLCAVGMCVCVCVCVVL